MAGLRIVFAGGGAFGLPALRQLMSAGHEISLVVSQPDRPAGRGRHLTPTPISQFALDRQLPLLRTANINTESIPDADLLVVIAFGQKIAQAVVTRPRLGAINLHASILPRYRGAAPINWAIARGETVAGNSIIRLADRMDAGHVLATDSLAIGELETAGELHDRLSESGGLLVARTVAQMADGQFTETAQDDTQATIAPKIARDVTRLDFSKPAEELARTVRGFYPWPGCRVSVREPSGKEIARATLVRARALPGASKLPAGSIDEDGAVSAGGSSRLQIVELQPEGKRPMSLTDYRRGNPFAFPLRLEPL